MPEANPLFQDIPQLAFLTDLESELGIASAFFNSLLDEDDWSFVVKLHHSLRLLLLICWL